MKILRILWAMPVLAALLLPATAQTSTKKAKSSLVSGLSADLAQLKTWFSGEFDNFEQVYKEKEIKAPEVHEHIHSIFAPMSAPAFGPHVFYVKQYMDGDPTKIYRQRLYAFRENAMEKALQLDIYSFPVDSLYYDAREKPEKLANLKPTDLTLTPGCAVYWKREGGQFTGYMKDKACNFVSKRSGKRVFITDSLTLTKDEIWIRDEAYDEEGKYVFGHKGRIHHKLKRVTPYKGWLALQKAGFENEYHAMRDLRLHDQGGRIRIIREEDGKPTKYSIELSTVIYGKDTEVLKLALYEEGKDKALTYVWGSPGSKNIGLNLRWIQVGLTRDDGVGAQAAQ